MSEILLGHYVSRRSPIHAAPAGIKVAALIAGVIAIGILVREPRHLVPPTLAVVVLTALARIPPRVVLRQLLPVLPFLVFIAGYQAWVAGIRPAVTIPGTILVSVALAVLVTTTTRVTDVLDALERGLAPLGRVGLPTGRISLALSLTIRMIPILAGTVGEVLDARRARGVTFSLSAFTVPVLIRSIRRAEALGDALAARGVDDE